MAIETATRTLKTLTRSKGSDAAQPPKPPTLKPAGIPNTNRREPNRLWMISGAAMVIIAGVISYGIFASSSSRVEVLATARAIAQGEVVTQTDFELVAIPTNSGIAAISVDDYLADPELVLGKTATGPIGAGVIVDPARFADDTTADQELVIVGAALQPGQYPIAGLAFGDAVAVLELSGQQSSGDDTGPRHLAEALVVGVTPLGTNGELFVSLEVAESDATSVADRVAEGRVRLALIDYDGSSDQ